MALSLITAPLVAVIIGFAGTLALLIAAAEAVGASPSQTVSWVAAICLAKAAETMLLSYRYKMPIVTAWSTAGLALVGTSLGFTIEEAVGAFMIAALLIIITGLFPPFTKLVARIPKGIAAAMLGGILVGFVISAAETVPKDAVLVVPLILGFFIVRAFSPTMAVIAVLIVGSMIVFLRGDIAVMPAFQFSRLEWIWPVFSVEAMIGLAVPIYLVTMASQNLPGIAVLKGCGYEPPTGPIITVTGLFSLFSAPFGASTTNLAAITAAICTGPDAHPDPNERWKTAFVYALCYGLLGICSASFVAFSLALPAILIILVAGLALLPPLTNAMALSMEDGPNRVASMATFAVTASSLSLFGIGSAFWGLLIGLFIYGFGQFAARNITNL